MCNRVLCFIATPLPPGENQFAVQVNKAIKQFIAIIIIIIIIIIITIIMEAHGSVVG
jgi:hypothetical protein